MAEALGAAERLGDGVAMQTLRIVTFAVALALALGEIARCWGQPRFAPMAFDEILVAGAMAWAAFDPRRAAPRLVAAWGVYCGLMMALLVPTLDHLMAGPHKPSAGFYAVVLAAMLALGLWALFRAIRELSSRR